MKRTRILLVGIMIFIFTNQAMAQESKFKALFLYKFAEYIEWPANPNKIIIGIAGKSDVFDELSAFTASRDNVEARMLSKAADSDQCHMVYIPESQIGQLQSFVSGIGGKSILLVTENSSYVTRGADIGFFLESDKLRFLIDSENIGSKKMIASSKLLSLGKAL